MPIYNFVVDLIDLSSPEMTQVDHETQKQQQQQIPLNEHQLTPKECDESIPHQSLRYSQLKTSDLETKPMTEKMDHWYLDLKKNLVNEFDKLRLQFLEEAQQNILHDKQGQVKEYSRLNQDIKIMREMLIHYEHTIDQKDQTEKNLNKALKLLYNKTIAYHYYYEWRLVYIEKRRQEYSLLLAKRFYEEKIKRRVLTNWKNLVEREWKKRFELACEKKSKAILNELNNKYELKYKQLELQLLNANEEIARLTVKKNVHDESVKKAFMRGVCALNMEAMSVFLKDEYELDRSISTNEEQQRQYDKHKANDNNYDEDVTLSESSKISNEPDRLKYSSYQHTCPAHVYKDSLSNTIYSTGEARSIHSNNHHRHVAFHKRQSMVTSRPRHTNSNILVKCHAPPANSRS